MQKKKINTGIKSVSCNEWKPLWQFKKSNETSIFSDYNPHSSSGTGDSRGSSPLEPLQSSGQFSRTKIAVIGLS